ncbi:MAG: C39 family peptidase [Anaerolineae bacterium]|nr:C39 family peptidase [Anaerolineae bacterium]
MYGTRSAGRRILFFLNFILAGLVVGGCVFALLQVEPIRRRAEALPFYVQTYWNKYRPKPELPPPPQVASVDPATLLQARHTDAQQPAPDNSVTVADAQLVENSSNAATAVAPQVQLTGVTHEWQTWNNCGPVTIAMNLSYFGHSGTQVESAQFLKPNKQDKNVNPDELAAYAHLQGLQALTRVGGDVSLLKRLLGNGLPVIVETWLDPEDSGGLGHYRLFTGYDEAENIFVAEDSLRGSRIRVSIDEFERFWQVFNRKYVLVFQPDQIEVVNAILGPQMDETRNFEDALFAAQREAEFSPGNAFAWFNIGTSYTALGEYSLAAAAFDEARRLGLPYRMLWYQFEIFEAYLAVGRYQEVIDLTSVTLEATGGLEELYYYRGQAQQALNRLDDAANDFRAALDYNPNFVPAAQALQKIEATS